MTIQDTKPTRSLDRISGIAYGLALLVALSLYFLFYAPAIDQGVSSNVLPAKGNLWLKIHIASYWISYSLYLTGLLLSAIYFLGKSSTRIPWIETATIIATILSIIGLLTGILFSKPAWNAWWVWDAKHTIVFLNSLFLLGVASLTVLTRRYSKSQDRNLWLFLLLFVAVALCACSFLSGFFRNIHPQWFPYIFFQ